MQDLLHQFLEAPEKDVDLIFDLWLNENRTALIVRSFYALFGN